MKPAGPGAVRLPPHAPGMRIGLYGGSFDPPHAGHRHVAATALRRLGLDRVWWLVTPRNPLKTRGDIGPRAARLAAARRVARHPRMEALDIESAIGARFTVETVRFLQRRCPGVRFVWIMGADSLADFQRWRSWREIAARLPIAVVDRPRHGLRSTRGRAAVVLASSRHREGAAIRLAAAPPPAWALLHGPLSELSSTVLRAEGRRESRLR